MKWYYSRRLRKYISLEPLKIDSNIINTAKENNIPLVWDDFGNIVNIDFDNARKLVSLIGGTMLSPNEYWTFYNELVRNNKTDVIDKLLSNQFTEILDRVYLRDGSYIDHPSIISKDNYDGKRIFNNILVGRPGWILPEDIDTKTGLPTKVRGKGKTHGLIKYWSPDLNVTKCNACFPIRGYVTSTSCVSFDLGIPVDSKQPKQMIRMCLKTKPKSVLSENELRKLEEDKYYNKGLTLVKKGKLGSKKLKYNDFKEYIKSIKEIFNDCIKNNKQIFLVMGHKNPDSDTVVSSLLESYRLHLLNKNKNHIYIPLIQANELPEEIKLIVGTDLCNYLLYENNIDIKELLESGLVRIVFTDQNYQKEYQKYVVSITDHHIMSSELIDKEMTIPCIDKIIGSCSALITIKYAGSGFDVDSKLADIFYSGMLMDTENRVAHKMTELDKCTMDIMKSKSNIKDDNTHYIKLMNELIKEKNLEKLYFRDYKKFFGFGFAVLKVKNFIEEKDFNKNIKKAIEIAEEDNKRNNYYVSLIKIVQYNSEDLSVDKERIYYVFSKMATGSIKKKCIELLSKIIKVSFHSAKITINDDYMEISNTKKQISRKKIAPLIETVLKKEGQFVYYESISKWVSRDFLKMNDFIKKYPHKLETDNKDRICNLNYLEAKELCKYLKGHMLTLKEYWQVYYEAKEKEQYLMLDALTDSSFIEFLDTTSDQVKDYLDASPGLISPNDIDLSTGLPKEIKSPDEYYNKSLWRYWSPPRSGETYVFSRSHIFLLNQPCLDAKTRLNEGYASLGIRLVRDNNIKYDIDIETKENELLIFYKSEYDDKRELLYKDSNFTE